ncbi:hypothetical protein [Photobacterium sp.]|uniref:hypothetical protein n=1 Tax=Photobacterium sp. TaxID=660 RepID=UPI00299D2F65|nr:hypothetical protein [Photobacterium sp.]MDX1302910.1 hypothetical protein [Photobacterium sp.]
MLQITMNYAEILLLVTGLLLITKSLFQYGKRTRDWSGLAMMIVKRVGMDTAEYRWYRLGVSYFVAGVVIRIANMIFWPQM